MRTTTRQTAAVISRSTPPWVKRIGIAGLLFFVAKGLAWVALSWWLLN